MPSTLYLPSPIRDDGVRSSFGRVGPLSPSPTAQLPTVGSGGRVLAFRPRTVSREGQVVQALADADARRPAAAEGLYDLINTSVYRMALAIAGDVEAAERATVAAFVEIWQTVGSRPRSAGTAWVLEVACRCTRSTLAADRRAARGLYVVPAV